MTNQVKVKIYSKLTITFENVHHAHECTDQFDALSSQMFVLIQIQTYNKIYQKQNFLIDVIILFINLDIYSLNYIRFI